MHQKLIQTAVIAGILSAGLAGAAPLADGAAKYLGNITTNGAVRSDFGTYWNQITAENECKWGSIEGTRGSYNFKGCDAAYNWAKNNGGHFKFHALVWGSQYPSWLANLSVADTKTAITAWFDAVAKHYPDLELIDVVNEAIRTGTNTYHSSYPSTKIIQALGGDNNDYAFVTTAFKMARERWPKAVLIYNDYNTVQWNKDQGINLINTIKKNGAPVDAYGLQAHDMMTQGGGAGGTGGGGSCLNINTLKSVIDEIWNKTQMPMFISEYDIATTDDNVQKQCYQEQIPYFMENEHIAGITLWGYIYGSTWVTGSGIIKNGADRPAMTWLKEYMASNKGKNTTGLLGATAATPDTVPQVPYKDAIAIPGTLEAENYDVGGQNQSYYDEDATNQGDTTYRNDRVDLVKLSNGYAVGYTVAGEWLEYTVNVSKADVYSFEVTAASGSDNSSFLMYVDNNAVSDTVKIKNGGDWDTYSVTSGTTKALTAGKHVLKIAITGSYANIDKITFTAGTTGISVNPAARAQMTNYIVYNLNGTQVTTIRAMTPSEAESNFHKAGSRLPRGIYWMKNTGNGNVHKIVNDGN